MQRIRGIAECKDNAFSIICKKRKNPSQWKVPTELRPQVRAIEKEWRTAQHRPTYKVKSSACMPFSIRNNMRPGDESRAAEMRISTD